MLNSFRICCFAIILSQVCATHHLEQPLPLSRRGQKDLIIDVNTPEGIEQILNLRNSNKKNIIQVVTRAILDEGIPKDSTIYRYNLTSTPHRPGVDQDLRRRYLDDDTKELYRQRDKVKKFHVENNRRAVTDEATQESTQPLHRRVVDKEGGFRNLLKSNDSP